MSLDEIRELREAWHEKQRRIEWRFGVLAMILIESNRDHTKPPQVQMSDLFPFLEDGSPDLPDEDAMEAKLEALAAAHGARRGT